MKSISRRAIVLTTMIIGISLLHYFTPVCHHYFHALYQRLYYIPVIIAAWHFGLIPGIFYALLASLLYLPHILIQWEHSAHDIFTQQIEVAMILIISTIVGILADREKREQQKQREALKQIAKVDRLALLGQLAAGLAHEIRNPLGGLLGSSEILLKEVPKESKAYPFVEILKKELLRMRDKLNYFLAFSKPAPPKKLHHNINTIIENTLPLVEKKASQANITITTNLQENIPPFLMDGEQMREILLNLILNAIQMMERDGEVTIETAIEEEKLFIAVEDSGSGVPDELKEKIFTPFFTTREKGTGLGLAIVSELISAMDGTIEVKDGALGARFEIRL